MVGRRVKSNNEKALRATVNKFMRNDPNASLANLHGQPVWKIVSEKGGNRFVSVVLGHLFVSNDASLLQKMFAKNPKAKEKVTRDEGEKASEDKTPEDTFAHVTPPAEESNRSYKSTTGSANSMNLRCVDEEGNPLKNVRVDLYFRKESSTKLAVASFTNDQGRVHFRNIFDREGPVFRKNTTSTSQKDTNHHIIAVAHRSGLASEISHSFITVEYFEKQGLDYTIAMKAASTLRGRVLDPNGHPVAGAQVSAGPSSHMCSSVGVRTATTDAEGWYVIADCAPQNEAGEQREIDEGSTIIPGPFDDDPFAPGAVISARRSPGGALIAIHPNFPTKRARIEHIPGTTDVQLEPASVIVGKIKLPDSQANNSLPLAGSFVQIRQMLSMGESSYGPRVNRAAIDETGSYRLQPLPAGKYCLTANVAGWVTHGIENMEVGPGETVIAPDISLTRGGRIRIQLVDDQTGKHLRFEKPTTGVITPRLKDKQITYFDTERTVLFSTAGIAEIQIPAGQQHIDVKIFPGSKREMSSYQAIGRPTHKVVDGKLLEITVRVRAAHR
ncbi:MAG: carboxypeptidase regulatory-like domain-containing protein [Planctomycetes bacterium]|nr:carboxypeptidase regulatory-like domain-containing protein [Planctomycetota bacterium]